MKSDDLLVLSDCLNDVIDGLSEMISGLKKTKENLEKIDTILLEIYSNNLPNQNTNDVY